MTTKRIDVKFGRLSEERAAALERARLHVDALPGADATTHQAATDEFHRAYARLYGPVEDAIARMRNGDQDAAEALLQFLEADPWCFRSGYVKAEITRVLNRADRLDTERLQAIVLKVVEAPTRREFGDYLRLARRTDSGGFREALRDLAHTGPPHARRHARWVLAALGETIREKGYGPSGVE